MLSIDKSHPEYAQRCRDLPVGNSAYSIQAEIPYDMHRYRDGWHVYWKNPPNGAIGRRLLFKTHVDAFLKGDWQVGFIVRPPQLAKFDWSGSPTRQV